MIAWLLHNFIASSAMMALVLVLRRPVARLFGAGWAYALWLIPALRFVLPPLPWPDLPILAPILAEVSIPTPAGTTALSPASAGPGQWVPFLLAIWAGGAVIFLILQWLAYRGFVRRLAGSARPARPPLYRGIATFVSGLVEGPLAIGLTEPRIVVPADFSRRYSPGERLLAMEHERTHHHHRDMWWNIAAIALLAVNWFNPLAWLAFRAFRTDQELACDASVTAWASAGERHDYARAMVKSASRPGLIAACPMNSAGALKQRLRMMRLHRASPARSAGGIAALAALALAGASAGGLRARPATASAVALASPGPRAAAPAPTRFAALSAPSRAPIAQPFAPIAIVPAPARHHRAPATASGPPAEMLAKADSGAPGAEREPSFDLAFSDAPAAPASLAMVSARAGEAAAPAATPAIIFRVNGGIVAYRISAAAQEAGGGPRLTVRVAHSVRTSRLPARIKLQIVEQGD
jgi:bla regulator protein BlaR1